MQHGNTRNILSIIITSNIQKHTNKIQIYQTFFQEYHKHNTL